MAIIQKISEHIVYENHSTQWPDKHPKFPGIIELPSNELLATYEIRRDTESADSKTYMSFSKDSGYSWDTPVELYNSKKLELGFSISETIKPTLLKDGTIIAIGYRFHRKDPKVSIGNSETGGLLPGDNVVCLSNDNGRTWTLPKVIEHGFPELLETSGPCVQLSSGDILAVGCPFKQWDGSNPSGQTGVLLRSLDKGKTWDCNVKYFTTAGDSISPWEARICEMSPGKIVGIVWAYKMSANEHLPNHIVVSHDNGYTWSEPFATPHLAQASNLMWLHGDLLLTIHSHRSDKDNGLFVRLIDFKNDKWKVVEEKKIWGTTQMQNTSADIIKQFTNLQFGQPSLIKTNNNEILAIHWCSGKILLHRLRINI